VTEIKPSLDEARARILDRAEPLEPVEVSLVDALGLVLAEPATADVDLPPFDRAGTEGYAVRAAEAQPGSLLRVAGVRWSRRAGEIAIEPGEAVRVEAGDPLPVGATAVLPLDDARADLEAGANRVIEVLRGVAGGQGVLPRGSTLTAGAILADAGERIRPAMIPLLAAQGCVHPVCHRRVRVAILAVGDHLVGPSDAPVMHRERNATSSALAGMLAAWNAMPHDLQAVAESGLRLGLERATNAPVVVVVGGGTNAVARACRTVGVEPAFAGVAIRPGGGTRYGMLVDDEGRVSSHVFHLPMAPVAAMTALALLVRPLVTRLQGVVSEVDGAIPVEWDGVHPASRGRTIAVPARFRIDEEGRNQARPVPFRGVDDLPGFAHADGLALLPARSGPWVGGEVVSYVPFA
jgi:molybdopterin molybdotransferase